MPTQPLKTEPLTPEQLRWRCDPATFAFETTAEVEPIRGIVGQDAALEALRFGLECAAPGQNIYVRGLSGTGRMTLVRRVLEDIRPDCPIAPDRIYVHNFDDPLQPRLITLPRGAASKLLEMMEEVVTFIRDQLAAALTSEAVAARFSALQERSRTAVRNAAQSLEDELKETDLALVMVSGGAASRPAIFPRVNGEPVPPEVFETKVAEGEVDEAAAAKVREHLEQLEDRVERLAVEMHRIMQEYQKNLRELMAIEPRLILRPMLD
ncbi:MAG: Lon-like protease helical domain-containing protein, partial [Phycisphaerales bacterium]